MKAMEKIYRECSMEDIIAFAKSYEPFEGYRCGLTSFDNIIRLDKSSLVVCVARPQSGKSTFLNYYTYLMGENNGWKTLYFTFETPIEKQCQIMASLYGSYSKCAEHFFTYYLHNLGDMEDLEAMIRQSHAKNGIDCVLLDNFTNMQYLAGREINTYVIGDMLSRLKRLAVELGICVILVTHTTKMDDDAEINPYSINGSANFYNIADFIFSLQVTDRRNFETTARALKIRDGNEKGRVGATAVMRYHEVTYSYSSIGNADAGNKSEIYQPDPKLTAEIFRKVVNECDGKGDTQTMQKAAPLPQGSDIQTIPSVSLGRPKAGKGGHDTHRKASPELLDCTVSVFNISAPKDRQHTADMPLRDALMLGEKHHAQIDRVRAVDKAADGAAYRELKRQLPCFTVSCLCGNGTDDIREYRPIIAVDIDGQDNPFLDLEDMRKRVSAWPHTLYCGLSVGGRGLFALIPTDTTRDTHKDAFRALERDFGKMGITIDRSCSNVNRLRYVSRDPKAYLNVNAAVYTERLQPQRPNTESTAPTPQRAMTESDMARFTAAMADIEANGLQITRNHADTMEIAKSLACALGEEGRKHLHTCRRQRVGYDELKTDRLFDSVSEYMEDNGRTYTINTFWKYYKDARRNEL